MNKKSLIIKIVALVVVLICAIVPTVQKKRAISNYENEVKEASKKAINALNAYQETGDFSYIEIATQELEECETYLQKISMKNNLENYTWDISRAIGQLKSFERGAEIKGLEELKKGLEFLENDVYCQGEGCFGSFVNKNMSWNNEAK